MLITNTKIIWFLQFQIFKQLFLLFRISLNRMYGYKKKAIF